MDSSSKLAIKAALVLGLAAFSMSRPSAAIAAQSTAAVGCTPFQCSEPGQDCNDVWLSISCIDCGGDAYPVCAPNLWECPSGSVYFGCGSAS
jgi:hypothetical protein